MEIKCKNNINDLVILNMDVFKRDSIIQKRIKIKRIIIPIIIIIIYFIIYHKKIDIFSILFGVIVSLIWILAYPKIAKIQYKKMLIKRLKNNIKNEFDLIVTVDQNGIREEGQNGNVTFSWDKVEEVKDVGTHIFIYISNLNAIVIPNSAFKNEEERKKLLKIISENIKNYLNN